MNNKAFDSNDIIKYFLLFLYIITGSLSNFGAPIYLPSMDISWKNVLTCIYFISKPNVLYAGLNKLFSSIFLYIYVFYVIWNFLSYFYAINPTETLINLPRVFNTFSAIFFCFLLIFNLPKKLYYVTRLFLFFLIAELLAYYNDLATVFPKEGLNVILIKGFAGNKNITAASIAFKLPFALYLVYFKKTFLKLLVIITLFEVS